MLRRKKKRLTNGKRGAVGAAGVDFARGRSTSISSSSSLSGLIACRLRCLIRGSGSNGADLLANCGFSLTGGVDEGEDEASANKLA